MQTPHAMPHEDPLLVVCLCAAWCGACREWRPLFDAVAASQPAMRFAWVDIEDEADTVGDVDIETFPTLLVARGKAPLFFGPLPPLKAQLEQLLARLNADARAGASVAPEASALLARLSLHLQM